MSDSKDIWQTKCLARSHDPAEKAMVLMRDPLGHEGGTVAELKSIMTGQEGINQETIDIVRKADRWAAAADRPQFPKKDPSQPDTHWDEVNFAKEPILYHPLSGDEFDLRNLEDVTLKDLKAVSLNHFKSLIYRYEDASLDWKRTFLSLWRYGPDRPHGDLGFFWRYLPADTRVPDHAIWDHLDLTSAFAGCFASDPGGTPALLTMSIGPIQSFIAQARSVSDMWAASHLLSSITWAAMKGLCDEFGPDCIIFPQLRGVPIVDLWLEKEMGVPHPNEPKDKKSKRISDAHPIFRAALPNKFTALVPASMAKELAAKAGQNAREWVRERAQKAASMLLAAANESEGSTFREQMMAQLSSFPEVHWSIVPWSLMEWDSRGNVASWKELSDALRTFYPDGTDEPGFFGSPVWKLISEKRAEENRFFSPNPGMLYPGLYDLGDRVFSAAKAARTFSQSIQEGFRCSMCGEREWLTLKREHLLLSPGERKGTLWQLISEKRPSWARKGEHLCSLCALKRLWPTIFVDEIKEHLETGVDRYVVSTHTMALATTMGRLLTGRNTSPKGEKAFDKLYHHIAEAKVPRAALPLSLHRRLKDAPEELRYVMERLPSYLDEIREAARSNEDGEGDQAVILIRCIEDLVAQIAATDSKEKPKARPEAYYALIMADGDNMGAWISGLDPRYCLTYRDTWHPRLRSALSEKGPAGWFAPFLDKQRPPSPGRHAAISSALNVFALELCGRVVEEFFKGKLIYAGGDDLLAMVSVDDLLPCLLMLRLIYSGEGIDARKALGTSLDELGVEKGVFVRANKGHVRIDKRLFRVMGRKATASFGAVVAHHTAPLASVMRELRAAEKRAKDSGRDAFSISIMKRAGGKTMLTLPWQMGTYGPSNGGSPMETLISIRNLLARKGMSRRAAYLIQQWGVGLPAPQGVGGIEAFKTLLKANLEYQFKRQYRPPKKAFDESSPKKAEICAAAASKLTELVAAEASKGKRAGSVLGEILTVAEFLAREGRFVPFEDEEA
jgi:CRISPR-associated protein Cmr2